MPHTQLSRTNCLVLCEGIKPALGAALVSAPATKLPQTLPWLVLSPDTLAGAGLVAGQYVQVNAGRCMKGHLLGEG